MPDQATSLRKLIRTARPTDRDARVDGPPMVAVTGSVPGAGATTVAVNMAAALAGRGQRVLLVDAAAERAGVAEVAGVRSIEYSLADLLSGKCTASEAVVPGPGGSMMLVERGRVSSRREAASRRKIDRREEGSGTGASRRDAATVFQELDSFGAMADLLVVDLGTGMTPWTRRFWLRSQLVLMVTTPDSSAILESYAAIKRSVADRLGPDARLLINQCDDEQLAADAQQRFAGACERFLGQAVPALPALPRCGEYDAPFGGSRPRVWENPDTAFGHSMLWLARTVSEVIEQQGFSSRERVAA